MRFRRFARYVRQNKVMPIGKLSVTGPTTLGAATLTSATITSLTANAGNINGLTSVTGLVNLVASAATITFLDMTISSGSTNNPGVLRIPCLASGGKTATRTNVTGSWFVDTAKDYWYIKLGTGVWSSGLLGAE